MEKSDKHCNKERCHTAGRCATNCGCARNCAEGCKSSCCPSCQCKMEGDGWLISYPPVYTGITECRKDGKTYYKVELPCGISKEDVTVQVKDSCVCIEYKKETKTDTECSCKSGKFTRTIAQGQGVAQACFCGNKILIEVEPLREGAKLKEGPLELTQKNCETK